MTRLMELQEVGGAGLARIGKGCYSQKPGLLIKQSVIDRLTSIPEIRVEVEGQRG